VHKFAYLFQKAALGRPLQNVAHDKAHLLSKSNVGTVQTASFQKQEKLEQEIAGLKTALAKANQSVSKCVAVICVTKAVLQYSVFVTSILEFALFCILVSATCTVQLCH